MKTIGLLGGMSWESSLEYYRIINEETKKELGETHSAKSIMYTFDFHEIEVMQHTAKWEELTDEMVEQSKNLKLAGADFIVICTNTMHLMADHIEKQGNIEVLHIADATGKAIEKQSLKKVALLGTKFTMESSFYKDILKAKYNIETIIPEKEDRDIIHDIIYKELVLGNIREDSKKEYLKIIDKLSKNGAEGMILGCTEIPLLIKQEDTHIPIFDTTDIHAKAAVKYALEEV